MKRSALLLGALCLLFVSLLSGCDRAAPAPQAEPGKSLLTFERSGGIAGFQDRLVIGYSGEYYLKSSQVERIGSLSAERTTQLRNWFVHLAPFTLRLEDNPGGPDNMVRQATWAGLGKVTATEAEQQEIQKWASDLLAELSKGS
jgi:hypothetical protein